MPITPPPAAVYPVESAQGTGDGQVDPRMLVGASAGMGEQPTQPQQDAGAMEGLKSMLAVVSGLAEAPGMGEGARMARQGIVQMMLALNQQGEPSQSAMSM